MHVHTIGLEDAEDLVSGDVLDLSDTVRVTQDDANLRGGKTLLGEARDVVADLLSADLQPRWRSALVWNRRLGNTLATSA